MKKSVFLLMGLAMAFMTEAQVVTPAASPSTTVKQTVGLTNFEINYSRPSLRGRDLHKEIVPYGTPWRFGANRSTTIAFDTPVTIEGKKLNPGLYSLFAIPGEGTWKIIFYTDTEGWGVPKEIDDKKVALTIPVKVEKVEPIVETFTISFDDLSNSNEVVLNVSWEHTSLPIHFELPTEKLAITSIEETIKEGKADKNDYYRAASYYLASKIRLDEALKYVDQAIKFSDDAPAYYVHTKALVLKEIGKDKDAIKTAQESMEIAKKQGYDEYVRKNEALIRELKK